MAQNFGEYLSEEFDRACKEFEKAKQEAAAEIFSMTHFTATDFGQHTPHTLIRLRWL